MSCLPHGLVSRIYNPDFFRIFEPSQISLMEKTSLNKQKRCYLISDWSKKIMKIRNLGLGIHETIW